MSRPMTARDAARYILARQDASIPPITAKKLHKLLYLAYGTALALLHRPLWDTEDLGDRVTAWKEGPVVPAVWREYKQFRGTPLPAPTNFDASEFDPVMLAMIDEVLAKYGQESAGKLAALTHKHVPWVETWAEAEGRTFGPAGYDVIPDRAIAGYFRQQWTGPADSAFETPAEVSARVRSQPGYAEDHARADAQIEAGQGMSLGELRRYLGL